MNDDDSPVCSACRQMDQRYRPGPTEVRDALHASDQDHAHLSPAACAAVQLLLGYIRVESTVRYLGVEVDDDLDIAEKIEV
jgi:hypothetical protein